MREKGNKALVSECQVTAGGVRRLLARISRMQALVSVYSPIAVLAGGFPHLGVSL